MSEVEYVFGGVTRSENVLPQPAPASSAVLESLHGAIRWKKDLGIVFMVADVALIFISSYLATSSRFSLAPQTWLLSNHSSFLKEFSAFFSFAILFALTGIACNVYSARKSKSALREISVLLKAVGMATLLWAVCTYPLDVRISYIAIWETVALSLVAMIGLRLMLKLEGDRLDRQKNVVIVGAGLAGQCVERHLSQNPHLGYSMKGYLDLRQGASGSQQIERRRNVKPLKMLGSVKDMATVAGGNFIDEVFITASNDRDLTRRLISDARRSGIDARVITDLYEVGIYTIEPEYAGQIPTIRFRHRVVSESALLTKRCIDITIAVISLSLFLPVWLFIAAIIKLSSSGPVFYRSTRIGKKGRDFTCYKFRTMVANADELRDGLHHLNERQSILFKIENDPRLTFVGRFLRKYSIDEVPQFLNVLRGNMSVVGPRPAMPNEYEQYAFEHLRRLNVAPGITGLWQVAARKDPSFENYIAFDLKYIDNWSVWLDCSIIIRTVGAVFAGTGQ